jgi:hypothetical protein
MADCASPTQKPCNPAISITGALAGFYNSATSMKQYAIRSLGLRIDTLTHTIVRVVYMLVDQITLLFVHLLGIDPR